MFNDITIYFIKKKWMSVKISHCPLQEGFKNVEIVDVKRNSINWISRTIQ